MLTGWILAGLTSLLTAVAASALQAQEARLLGRVTDSAGRPLRDAEVVLERQDARAESLATTSGVTGGYQFTGVSAGVYRVTTRRPGYRGQALRVRVTEGVVLIPVLRLPAGQATRPRRRVP